MKTKKTISLSTKDLQSTIKSLQKLSSGLQDLQTTICKDVAELGKEYLDDEYSQAQTDQTIDISTISTSIEATKRGYSIFAKGSDVVYEEFGTGEEGHDNPHPDKNKYNLNDYNSGPFVSTHINKYNRHYWFYKGYSEGNPSGAEMFNTVRFLKEKGIKDVCKKKASDLLSKV